MSANLQPNTPFSRWDQSGVEKEQYRFESKKAASDAIKSAARVFGAVKCGIAKRDKPDLEFVEYDRPHTWGITDFCLSCGKCAENCPADAIPMPDDKNGGYGFEPSYEFSDEPGYTWNNHLGIKKFYSDAKKCFNFWVDNGSSCGACISSCTFNEPDYWHHVFIMGITPWSPGPLHALMAELHPAFGYGHTNDPAKVKKFWKTGEGMRTNIDLKNTIGTSNKS